MFKFLREAATKASLANLDRSIQVLVIQSNNDSPRETRLDQLKSMLTDANLAIQNSKKTDKPISGEDIVEICEGLIARQGIEVGRARGALNAFYDEVKKIG